MATIQTRHDFQADILAKELHYAFKGFGTNEGVIINVLTGYSNKQIQVCEREKSLYMYFFMAQEFPLGTFFILRGSARPQRRMKYTKISYNFCKHVFHYMFPSLLC